MKLPVAFVMLAACSSAGGKDVIPTLDVTSPTRGATSDGTQLTVTGTATDDGPLTVTVNAQPVPLAKDGSFSATITVPAGLALIETHAVDRTGHDVRDVRAVLAGPLAPADGSQASPIGAHASPAALTAVAKDLANDAEQIDYTSLAQGLNPIYNNGGCLGAVIDITSISIGSIGANITPKSGALGVAVDLNNVVVKLHASYKVACLGGSTTITVSASAAHVTGDLDVAVSNGKLAATLPSDSIVLDNFNLSVSGVPGTIVDLFNSVVRGKVESALAGMLKSKVPPIVDQKLAGMFAKPLTASVLGHATAITVDPTAVSISSSGLFASAQSTLVVTDGTGAMYSAIPAALDEQQMAQAHGLGIALAADLVNELLAGLWAAHAFDMQLPTSKVGLLASLLDPDATQLAITMSLPPMVSPTANGQLQLAVGDAIIVLKDDSGAELSRVALSVTTTLVAGQSQSGKLLLTVGQPTVYADVIDQDPNSSRPLTDDQVQGIVSGAWGLVGDQANQALGKLPMPTLGGVTLGAPTITGTPGFVSADIPVTQPAM